MGKFRFWCFDSRKHFFTDEVAQMSATDISNAKTCEYKLYYKFTQAVKMVKNVYLIMGSVFHSVIEQDLRYKSGRGVNKKWDDLLAYFEVEWAKQIRGISDFGKYTEQQAKAICLNYIKIYTVKMSPMLYPLNNDGIEKFFRVYVSFGGKRLGITGKIDLIDRSMYVVDHKTASNLSKWENYKVDDDIQGFLYPYCLKSLGYDVKGFRYNIVSGSIIKVIDIEYDTSKVANLLRFAFQVKDRIESGAMLQAKNIFDCKYCEYKECCDKRLI